MDQESYEEHRRRLLLAQFPSATVVVCFATLIYLVVVLLIQKHWAIGLLAPLLFELIVPAIALVLVKGPLGNRPEAAALGADALFTLATTAQLLLPYSTTSGVALVLCLKMLATALFFPWGARMQNLSAAASVILYLLLLAASGRPLEPVVFVHQVIAPFIAVIISVAGAANADRSRRDVYERDSALARSEAGLRMLLASVRESDARKSAILESVADPILTVDGAGRILECNPAAERVFGHPREQLAGSSIERLIVAPQEDSTGWSLLGRSARERSAILGKRMELSATRADGTVIPVEMTVTEVRHEGPAMLTVYLCDLTERKRVEDQMRQQQSELAHALRVATMGQMAAEVGHEINQPLAAIVSFAKGLSARLHASVETADMAKAADKISAEALRAAEVVRRQREFLRRGAPQRAPVELNGLVRDAAHLIEPDARRHEIAIRIALDPSIPLLDLDRIQIEQVVLNLLRNGLEAIVEAGRTRNELLVETCMIDGGAQVTVSDTGVGLSAAACEEAFTPFYTTKPKGLGLGLSIGRSIIEAHGGRIWAAPNHSRGATFGFRLPLPESDAATAGAVAAG